MSHENTQLLSDKSQKLCRISNEKILAENQLVHVSMKRLPVAFEKLVQLKKIRNTHVLCLNLTSFRSLHSILQQYNNCTNLLTSKYHFQITNLYLTYPRSVSGSNRIVQTCFFFMSY